nr:SpaA isopeptide-forming pilin-related protein [Paucilactobacillus hokkaidonensis]
MTETKTPEGYKTADPFKVTIHQQNETHHYSVVNNVLEERLKVVKADAESGKTIPRANAGFKIKSLQTGKYVSMPNLNHDGTTDTFMTNEEGYLTTTEALPYGQYELVETQAPLGYVLAKDPAKFSITGKDSDGIVTVKFTDKSQKGIVTLHKTGATPVEVTKQSTKYGEQYGFNYDYTPLAGAKFEFTASKNITTADGTVHAKKGEIVATATTDANGQIKTPQLYLGKYSVKEVAAPNGFILNDKPIDFELKYAGQNVEVTSTSLKATNDFQKLNVVVNKQAEQIKSWDKNKPTLENKAANGQVFGLFSKAGYNKGDINVPAKALVATATVKDGKATFADIQLPEGSYYVQELDAGEAYQLDDQTYDFEFKATDNTTTKNLTINGDKDTPILNKLHFNEFTFKKINETAKLVEDKGYQFTFDGNAKGAVFELLDKDKKVIQTTTIDDKSIGAFKNVPVGTFYLREKTPSATNLVLTKDLTKIVSTKTGITVYDAKGQLISQDKKNRQTKKQQLKLKKPPKKPEISFTLKNNLIKGTGELTKTDVSNGKVLPNTGIKVLDQDGKTVVSGRTNDKGIFSFATCLLANTNLWSMTHQKVTRSMKHLSILKSLKMVKSSRRK